MTEVVVDVGSWAFKVVWLKEIDWANKKIILKDYKIYPVGEGIFGKSYSEKALMQPDTYAQYVKDCVKNFGISNSYTFLLLPSYFSRYAVRVVPAKVEDMVDQMVEDQLRELPLIPVGPEKQIVKWQITERGKIFRVFMASILTDNFYDLVKPWAEAGVCLTGVDFDTFNLTNFVDIFTVKDDYKQDLTLVVHVGASDAIIQIYHNNSLKSSDQITITLGDKQQASPAGYTVTKLLMDGRKLNYQEAEKFKKEANIIPDDLSKTNPNFEMIRGVLYGFLTSLNNMIDRKLASLRLDVSKGYLIMTGGGSILKNFKEFVKKNWYFKPVELSEIWEVVKESGEKVPDDDVAILAPALGVLLR